MSLKNNQKFINLIIFKCHTKEVFVNSLLMSVRSVFVSCDINNV